MVSTLVIGTVLAQAGGGISVTPVKTVVGKRIVAVAAAQSGSRAAVSLEDGRIDIIDGRNGATLFSLTGHPQQAQALAFNADGTRLASGDETGRVWVWDLSRRVRLAEMPRDKGHTRGVQAISYSRDGRTIASVGKDDVIKVWPAGGGQPVATLLGRGINFYGVGFSSTGALVTGTLGDGARIYNPRGWAQAATFGPRPVVGSNNVAVNKAGTLALLPGRNGQSLVYNLADRSVVSRLPGHQDWVISGAFTPNGRFAFTSSTDRSIRVYNVRSGQSLITISKGSFMGSPLAVTADGAQLVTSNDSDELTIYRISPAQLR